MWDDPDSAAARRLRLQAARRRLQESQRRDLIAAARVLIPEYGLSISLGRLAVHVGLARHLAYTLFNSTADLVVVLVHRAWHALIERSGELLAGTPQDLVAGLIAAIRDDAPAHHIRAAMQCGAARFQMAALAEADILLVRALGGAWRELHPELDYQTGDAIGGRLLVLVRAAALAAQPADDQAEAALIIAMIAPLATPQPVQAPAAPAPCPAAIAPPRPSLRADRRPRVAAPQGGHRALARRGYHALARRGHDPPADAA